MLSARVSEEMGLDALVYQACLISISGCTSCWHIAALACDLTNFTLATCKGLKKKGCSHSVWPCFPSTDFLLHEEKDDV